jgi:copper homeostasis protein
MIVEVCANSYLSALNAKKARADRIELCTELAVGGITPSYGLIKKVREDIDIPTNVLIRPRSGDFTYSNVEFDIMKQNILYCKEQGCNGIVSGVLNTNFTIDTKRTKELIDLANPLSFTFHRAFDWVKSPFNALEQLIDLGVDRILTSGQETTAEKGISLIEKLQTKARNKLILLPGGGISRANILQFKNAHFKEVHFSAIKLYKTLDFINVSMNSSRLFDETQLPISDMTNIKEMVDLVK